LRLRAALLCWFSLSFTTCFGLHGHLQVWRLCFRLRAALLCFFSLSFTTCFGLHGHLQVWRLCFHLRAALFCWFPLSFTTCFGLHSHLQGCTCLLIFKDSASASIFHYMFWAMWPSSGVHVFFYLRSLLLLVSFTACFGLHGHLQVCTYLLKFKDSASAISFIFLYLRTLLLLVSFTTCFALLGHLQVRNIFLFHMSKGFCCAAFFLPFLKLS
jgi:hypothetical protein